MDEQAAGWAARAAFGTMTTQDKAEFEAWLAGNPRCEGAYLRARASLYLLEETVLSRPVGNLSDNDNMPEPAIPLRSYRRWPARVAAAGLAVAACVAGVMVFGLPRMTPDNAPKVAAIRTMTLADGSRVVLGSDGAISAMMAQGVRRITLDRGMATFHVAKDRARPFIVQSGEVYAQATGTIYSVRRQGRVGGIVSVTEGSVLVWARGAKDRAVLLHAGGTLTVDPAAFSAKSGISASVAEPTGARGEFSFDNVTIAVATARFNAVNRTKIVIADAETGNVPIEGLFRADQPGKFAKAAAAVAGARAITQQGKIVIEK